jgi:hypothetical protein
MVRRAANALRSNRGASRLDVICANLGLRGRRVRPRVVMAWLAVWRVGHRPIRGIDRAAGGHRSDDLNDGDRRVRSVASADAAR